MEIIKNKQVTGKHRKPILTDLAFEKNRQPKPIVVFCHGYKGYKDWGAFDQMAATFVSKGVFLVKFNFSHNGGTPAQPIDFPDLEAFGQNNFTKELDDLTSVLDWLLVQEPFSEEIDPQDITLIGHSRGGGIVTIKASEDTRVTRLVTWAAVSDYGARFPSGSPLAFWKKEGVAYVENARTRQNMPHYIQFYQNFIENKDRLSIQKAAQKLCIPHLIVHGTSDETVPVLEAENLHSWSSKSELFLLQEATHSFGAKQPWDEPVLPVAFQEVLRQTIHFIFST